MSVNDNGVALNTVFSPTVTGEGLKSTERVDNVGGRKRGWVWGLIILQ